MSLIHFNSLPVSMANEQTVPDSRTNDFSSKQLYEKSRVMLKKREKLANSSDVTRKERDELDSKIVEILMKIEPRDLPNKNLISEEEALDIGIEHLSAKHRKQITSRTVETHGALIIVQFERELPPRVLGRTNLGMYAIDGYTGIILQIFRG